MVSEISNTGPHFLNSHMLNMKYFVPPVNFIPHFVKWAQPAQNYHTIAETVFEHHTLFMRIVPLDLNFSY